MNKKGVTIFSILIILAFMAYIIIDFIKPATVDVNMETGNGSTEIPDSWRVTNEIKINEGALKSVTISPEGMVFLGGDSFVSCHDSAFNLLWNLKTASPVTSLAFFDDTIFASTHEQVLLITSSGKSLCEWGPFEEKCIITSVSANKHYVAIADAGNKMVFILDKGGEVKKMIGQNDGQFVIPSPYFDVALSSENRLFVANTGHRRIESRNIDGVISSYFGEPGIGPDSFCGCCNPAHFIVVPEGFVTAEKGLNRIKVLDSKGKFVEYVSSKNSFVPSVPVDLASSGGRIIYAANPADSKLYVYKRK